ncbi:MAG: phytoene desaturase family protein [Gemmatimonadota bacterium]
MRRAGTLYCPAVRDIVIPKRNGHGQSRPDAVVVGSGPNGLSAALVLAGAGYGVRIYEAEVEPGGGLRTAELTRPGFRHDVCSAIHPMAAASPFFRSLPLAEHGLEWIQPDAPLAHPLPDGGVVLLERSIDATAHGLGPDGDAWRSLVEPFVEGWPKIVGSVLGPPVRPPRHPLAMARFGRLALRSAEAVGRRFRGERAAALWAGLAAHSMTALDRPLTAGIGLVLSVIAHLEGWPFPRGGSDRLAQAMISILSERGGEIVTGRRIESLDDLPPAGATLLDVTPRQLLRIAGERLPPGYRRALARFRYGPAAYKVDWALDGPIPWQADECGRAGTVHVGGTAEEIRAGEGLVDRGGHPDRPFVLLAQPTLFDPDRAPAGKHVAWAYCHVPNGSTVDMTEAIERQVERFAPGFGERILARHVMGPAALEAHNANLVGGHVNGGLQDLRQTFARPVLRLDPYATPLAGLYLCSSSTPPGGGVHGMCGYHAARSALRGALRGRKTRATFTAS